VLLPGTAGGGGGNVSSSLSSLPNASLTVSNVGGAASQALKVNQDASNYANQSTSVGTITNSTMGNPNNLPTFGGLSLVTQNPSKLVVKPSYLKQTILDQLDSLKTLQSSGCNTTPTVTDNSTTSGSVTNVNITSTWSNVSCSYSGLTFTLNGSVSWIGTYDSSAGSANLTLTYTNFTFGETYSGSSMSMTWNGGITFTGSGMLSGSSNIQFTEDGTLNLTGTESGAQGSVGFSGWFSIDDTFSGNVSLFTLVLNEGNEFDVTSGSGSAKIGSYLQTTPSLTISTTANTTVLNGSGMAGVAYIVNGQNITTGTASYSGKYSFAFDNLTYDSTVCPYCPSSGTLTLTSGTQSFVFTYSSSSCSTGQCCATVTGSASSQVCW
ncbi:MAG: hypothetical protein M1491_05145, partial [Deltaproteobacteria bacterium]|nr:hypothetical protein [Deltaproteobacteria bacterium]